MSAPPQAPGPGGASLLGSWREFRRDPLQTMVRWREQYGDLLRFRLGRRAFFMLSHPALAEAVLIDREAEFTKVGQVHKNTGFILVFGNGLVTSTGELWRRQRRLIQPVFHRSKVMAFAPRMAECAEAMLARWDRLPPGQPVALGQEMMRLTLEVITQTMFNRSLLAESGELGAALDTVLRHATDTLRNPLQPPLWLPTPGNRRFKQALALLDRTIYGLIEERRQNGGGADDFLDLLLAARDEATGEGMSDRQLRDEVLTVFVAGHETTATALAWTWCLLARHPEALARLHQELDEALQGRAPTAADLPSLPWTRAVFDEAMRLYPPAPGILRAPLRDTELGGYAVPQGAILFINFYNLHRHPDFWPEPDAFRPERFLQDAKPGHKLAFLPFSAGPRVCAGRHFALVEGPLLLALIARRYDLRLAPGAEVEAELHATLKPKAGLAMVPVRRG